MLYVLFYLSLPRCLVWKKFANQAENTVSKSIVSANVAIWECGAASYKWHYNQDEAYFVISGEGFMTDEKGVEHRFGAGDVAFFPAGTNATWRHPDHFRKVAFLKEAISRPIGFGVKVWNKVMRTLGLTRKSPLMLALAAWTSGQLR